MKLKYIVAALGLVASAASQAAITPVAPLGQGTGELMLVVWDANQSYTLDLGITFNQFLTTGTSTLATLGGSNWSSFLGIADQANWQYAVFGGNGNQSPVNNASVVSTINASEVGTLDTTYDNSNVQTALAQISTFSTAVNNTGTHSAVANGDSVNAKGSAAYFKQTEMDTFNFSFFNNSSAVGTSMAIEQAQRTQLTQGVLIERAKGDISFGQVGGNYVLSYASVAAVPEASGFGLALAGFGAIGFVGSRRRNRR